MSVEYSFSRLELYRQCPRQYHKVYHENNRKEETDVLSFGHVVHSALEAWHAPDAKNDTANLLDLYDQYWRESKLTDVNLYMDGRKMLERYLADPSHYAYETIATELGFGRRFNRPLAIGNVWMTGVIDRIDRVDEQTLELVDYKTGSVGFDYDEAAAKIQLYLYSIVAKTLFPQYRYHRLVYHYLKYGRLEVDEVDTYDEHAYGSFVSYIENLVAQIEKDLTWEPKLNPFCSTCHVRFDCPLYRQAVDRGEFPKLDDSDDIEQLWQARERYSQYIKLLEKEKEQTDALIKAWMNGNNTSSVVLPSSGDMLVLEPDHTSTYQFDVVLALAGADNISKLVAVRKKDVDAFFKGNKEALGILRKTAQVSYSKPKLRLKPKKATAVANTDESVGESNA